MKPFEIAMQMATEELKDVIEIVKEDAEKEYKPPGYGTKGWIIVEIVDVYKEGIIKYSVEEWAVDQEASTYWISEGVGIEFWLEHCANFEFTPGWWVIEDVVGTYVKGDGWITDDDEEWEHGKIRPATPEEIAQITVIKENDNG